MAQISFTPTDNELIPKINEIASREKQTLSKMIDILLHRAVNERERNRKGKNAKEDNS